MDHFLRYVRPGEEVGGIRQTLVPALILAPVRSRACILRFFFGRVASDCMSGLNRLFSCFPILAENDCCLLAEICLGSAALDLKIDETTTCLLALSSHS